MHPVAHYRSEVDDLKAQIADLTTRLDGLAPPKAAPAEPTLPPGTHRDACGLIRNGKGEVWKPAESAEQYQARINERAALYLAGHAARIAASTAGLPPGCWRDPNGMVRDRDGRTFVLSQRERDDLAAVNTIKAAEHRAWLQAQGLPVRSTAEGAI